MNFVTCLVFELDGSLVLYLSWRSVWRVESSLVIDKPKIKCKQVKNLLYLPLCDLIKSHKRKMINLINIFFQSTSKVLKPIMLMTKTSNNHKIFTIMNFVTGLNIDRFWEIIRHIFSFYTCFEIRFQKS